jgi:eukaryotic-like serine/threonine-protein kinase
LCVAVEAAHAGGVIHRDLKPENIMIADVVDQWRVVVLDFGLAKFRSDLLSGEQSLTVSGVLMGTLGYMSPEQRSGRKVDPSTDVYSVAVICAETLTGRRPPRNGISPEWLKSAFRNALPVHGQLRRMVERALAQNPRQRPSLLEILDCLPNSESVRPPLPFSPLSLEKAETSTDSRGIGNLESLTSELDTENGEKTEM